MDSKPQKFETFAWKHSGHSISIKLNCVNALLFSVSFVKLFTKSALRALPFSATTTMMMMMMMNVALTKFEKYDRQGWRLNLYIQHVMGIVGYICLLLSPGSSSSLAKQDFPIEIGCSLHDFVCTFLFNVELVRSEIYSCIWYWKNCLYANMDYWFLFRHSSLNNNVSLSLKYLNSSLSINNFFSIAN